LLPYPPLMVVLGCFEFRSLFCMFFRYCLYGFVRFSDLVPPLIGAAPVTVHRIYEDS
jgi:hypothetical protein